jgi:hypothetical protein
MRKSTPKASLGTVKKSIAAMASRWLFRKAFHCFPGSGFLGAFRIHLKTVRSEMSKPSSFNSPCIRGAPHLGVSPTMRKINSRNSLLTHFRASFMPRAPCPIQLETGSMPTNDCVRLDDDKRALPPRPEPPQHHPKDPIRSSKPWLTAPSLQDSELLSQSQNLW